MARLGEKAAVAGWRRRSPDLQPEVARQFVQRGGILAAAVRPAVKQGPPIWRLGGLVGGWVACVVTGFSGTHMRRVL